MYPFGQPYRFGNPAATQPPAAGGPSSAVVSLAGTPGANDTYEYAGESVGFPFYFVDDKSILFGAEVANAWTIYDAVANPLYNSSADAAPFPWLAASWEVNSGDAPAPTVTEG